MHLGQWEAIAWNNCGLYFCLLSRELKDNLGNDEPEGDMPVLLQTLLSRNPKIFRDKSMPTQYKVWGGKEEMLSRAVDAAVKLSEC